tara:strand:- start:620 stop:730 length:111 start_codon:yes stop_codon:yes gene_type:complete
MDTTKPAETILLDFANSPFNLTFSAEQAFEASDLVL